MSFTDGGTGASFCLLPSLPCAAGRAIADREI